MLEWNAIEYVVVIVENGNNDNDDGDMSNGLATTDACK